MSTVVEPKKEAASDAAGHKNKKESGSKTFEGRIVSMTGEKLVMSSKEGTEYTHTLAKDAKLTCDGKVCKADALKPGHKIRVTTTKEDRHVATAIESLNKNADFAECGSACS